MLKNFFILIIIMTTIWGLLTKSLVDNETIEQAIDRIVAAHNADETAHLGTGQSLQSHKASEIIDHLARSILRDKLKFNRFVIDEHFSTIDAWGISGNVSVVSISEVGIWTASLIDSESYMYIQPGEGTEGQADKEQNPVWETRVKFDDSASQIAYIKQGPPDDIGGVGFKVVNSTLYAVYWDAANNEQLEEITGINIYPFHTYRVEYVNGVSVKWYVDGVLKKTLTSYFPSTGAFYISYYIKTTAVGAKNIFIQSLHFDADYI